MEIIDPEQIPQDWDPSIGQLEFNFADWLTARYDAGGVAQPAEVQARLDLLRETYKELKSSKSSSTTSSSSNNNMPATPLPTQPTLAHAGNDPSDQSSQ